MSKILIIIIIVVIVIAILLVVVGYLIQFRRYHWLRHPYALEYLDQRYQDWMKSERGQKRAFGKEKIIVSLSTIPDRIGLLGPTLASILDQTVLPDEICVNVPMLSRKGKEYQIPHWLRDLKSVTIYRVDEDEGPGTKLLPTLRRERANPSTRIIVIDDDNIYNSKTLEWLLETSQRHEKNGAKVAVTGYGVSLDEKGELPGILERGRTMFTGERETHLLQGFSGFLVTPAIFPEEAYDIKSGPKEAISVDDVWFSGWLAVYGVKIIALAHTFRHMPLINYGDIRATPALAHGENKNFVTDMKVIRWFMETHGIWKEER